jgi:hypothetical protein
MAPAFSHLSIIRRITPSVTRWSRNARKALGPDRVPQAIECLVGRAAWSEAIRAG